MMKKIFSMLMVIFILSSAGCGIMDDLKDIVAGIAVDFNVDANINTTSELGDNTLARVDAINETLATGIEVGPETRETIEELNKTIADGLKAGFDQDTLDRVDHLLRIVEDGLKIGLDEQTLASIDGMVETIDRMPSNWEATGMNIIQTLENTAGSTAKTLADEVKALMKEAKQTYQQMAAISGVEFRCNVDFLGSKTGATAQEFIGKSIIGKLKNILSGKSGDETIPIPWVCQIIPDSIELSKVGDRLVFTDGIINLVGYNYVQANAPSAVIMDEAGNLVPGINLYPYLSSPYQIQLNLQDLDMSMVPPRSRIVLSWPNVQESSGIAILMPGFAGPVADFSADKFSGTAPLTVQFTDTSTGDPSEWKWVFGDGNVSREQNPSHEFKDKRDYLVQLTVVNALGESSVIKTVSVDTPLTADFSMDKKSGDVGLLVQFTDKSKGGPTSWRWDFGDGTPPSDEQNPSHIYWDPNPDGYQVTLTVNSTQGTSSKSATDRIKIYEALDARFSADKVSGMIPLTVNFIDESLGGSAIESRLWDFGDGNTSTNPNPTHTYAEAGNYTVSLTITRSDGRKDVEPKNAFINAYKRILVNPGILSGVILPSVKNESVFYTFFHVQGGNSVNTSISSSKYVCGISGFSAQNGWISNYRVNQDGLRNFMYQSQGTWWIFSEFQDIDDSVLPKESWTVNIICFDRSMEGSVFLYRDDFKNITGGTPYQTDLSTSTFFNCGIMGVAGLGVTGFRPNWYSEVALDAIIKSVGNKWSINSKMDVIDGGDTWNINALCLYQKAYMNVG
jgi:PKD repeat protein